MFTGTERFGEVESHRSYQSASKPPNLLQPIQTGGDAVRVVDSKDLKGPSTAWKPVSASLYSDGAMPIRHVLEFMIVGQRGELAGESIHDEQCSKIGVLVSERTNPGGGPQLVSEIMDAGGCAGNWRYGHYLRKCSWRQVPESSESC